MNYKPEQSTDQEVHEKYEYIRKHKSNKNRTIR